MEKELIEILKTEAVLKRSLALYTLKLFAHNPVGVGEHSTGDLYKDIKSAFKEYCEAFDELDRLNDLERDLHA